MNHSSPTDIILVHEVEHQNVEGLQKLELPMNAEFQHLDISMKSEEEKHIEDIIRISSQ